MTPTQKTYFGKTWFSDGLNHYNWKQFTIGFSKGQRSALKNI